MDWGVHLPHLGKAADRENLLHFAQRVDELGFHSGWASDHIAWPREILSSYPYTSDGSFPAPPGTAWLDPISTLTFVAGCTENLKLGTTVLILGYRPPVQTAKMFASLDVLSGGRALLGVGVGWMKEEFDVLQMPYDNRGKRGDEMLDLFEVLFADGDPSFDGRWYQVPEIGFEPKPVNGRIPVWVGGNSEPAWRRVVRYGDAFHAAFEPLDDTVAAWARIGELCDDAGRSRDELTLSTRLYLDPGGVMGKPGVSIQGTPEQMVEQANEWAAIGVRHLVLDPVVPGGPSARMEALERFMTEVDPAVA